MQVYYGFQMGFRIVLLSLLGMQLVQHSVQQSMMGGGDDMGGGSGMGGGDAMGGGSGMGGGMADNGMGNSMGGGDAKEKDEENKDRWQWVSGSVFEMIKFLEYTVFVDVIVKIRCNLLQMAMTVSSSQISESSFVQSCTHYCHLSHLPMLFHYLPLYI